MMHPQLRAAFEQEMLAAQAAYQRQEWREAFRLLERAHILGQHHAIAHTRTHILFLQVGWQRRDVWEIIGQCMRIVGGFIGSLLGKVPVGNTGGADVSAFAEMPIPEDLREILIKDERSWQGIVKAREKAGLKR